MLEQSDILLKSSNNPNNNHIFLISQSNRKSTLRKNPKPKQLESSFTSFSSSINQEKNESINEENESINENIESKKKEENPLKCPNLSCQREFRSRFKLNRHMNKHTKEKNYECDLCGKLFSLDYNLKTHRKLHTDKENNYPCQFSGCKKEFFKSCYLLEHEKICDYNINRRNNNEIENKKEKVLFFKTVYIDKDKDKEGKEVKDDRNINEVNVIGSRSSNNKGLYKEIKLVSNGFFIENGILYLKEDKENRKEIGKICLL